MSVSLPERSQISACVFVLGLLCHSSLLLNAQSQASPQTKERQIRVQEPLRTASASRIDLAPKLDGTLDDPIWQQASAIDNFLQSSRPNCGVMSVRSWMITLRSSLTLPMTGVMRTYFKSIRWARNAML